MKSLASLILIFLLIVSCEKENKTAEDYYQQQNYHQALELFKFRAKSGDAEAQNYLGMIYYLGLTDDRNLNQARSWFEKAAKQKHPAAQLNYGMVIEQQAVEAVDFLESYKWYFAAHANGSKEAEKRIQHLLEHHRIFHNQRTYAQKEMVPYINFDQKK